MTTFLKILLSPLSLIYHLITGFRNHLYNIGHKRSHRFSVLTIGVGNLKVGGVGKTPFSEYLISEFLIKNRKVAYLSRGYGRSTKGFLEVLSTSKADKVGDESLQVANKFPELKTFVCEDRVMAVPQILHAYPETEAIVLDDVYQHRRITPHVNLLLTAYNDLFVDDDILPSGRLRESKKGAKRADLVVVTKCPSGLSQDEKEEIVNRLKPYLSPGVSVLFASSNYGEYVQVTGQDTVSNEVICVSALANNEPFVDAVTQSKTVKKAFGYGDHHFFKPKEIEEIVNFTHENGLDQLVTSEKDWERLKQYQNLFESAKIKVAVLPFYFKLEGEQVLWDLIKNEESKI